MNLSQDFFLTIRLEFGFVRFVSVSNLFSNFTKTKMRNLLRHTSLYRTISQSGRSLRFGPKYLLNILEPTTKSSNYFFHKITNDLHQIYIRRPFVFCICEVKKEIRNQNKSCKTSPNPNSSLIVKKKSWLEFTYRSGHFNPWSIHIEQSKLQLKCESHQSSSVNMKIQTQS